MPEIEKVPEKLEQRTQLTPLAARDNCVNSCVRQIMKEYFKSTIQNTASVAPTGETMDVICHWERVRPEGKVIGTRYIIRLLNSRFGKESGESLFLNVADKSKVVFAYNNPLNVFHPQSATEPYSNFAQTISMVSREPSAQSLSEAQTPGAAAPTSKLKKYAKFFREVLVRVERLGDPGLLDALRQKPNYEENVVTWRVNVGVKNAAKDGEFVRVENDIACGTSTFDEEESGEQGRGGRGKKGNSDKRAELLFEGSLRNKQNLKRLVKSLPIPWGFMQLTFVCLLSAMVSLGMLVAVYVTFNSLFSTLEDENDMVKYQMSSTRNAWEALICCLHMCAFNEYSSPIV